MSRHEQLPAPGPSSPAPPPSSTTGVPAVRGAPDQPPPFQPSPPLHPPAPAYRPTSGLAVVSLVLGILSYVFLPLLGALLAILTGHFARAEIRRNAAHIEGAGIALGGLILGYLNLLLMVTMVLMSILLFGSMTLFFRHVVTELVNALN